MLRSISHGRQGLSRAWLLSAAITLTLCINPPIGFTQAAAPPDLQGDELSRSRGTPSATPDETTQIEELRHAAVRLPLATGLACALALRPRRRGTPARRPAVIQTQIILAVIGAIVMLVVGSSLARAFGIVGAAGLIRYRAKIEDPKDAGVMLSTLAIGLACGVGLWVLAIFGTGFILTLLWAVESFEPMATRVFALKIKAKDPAALRERVEHELSKARAPFELRGASQNELQYEVKWPLERTTDRLSKSILALGPADSTEVEWEQKSEKKS